MMRNYLIVQIFDGNKWVNYSCHYFFSEPRMVFAQYAYWKRKNPGKLFRIARGRANVCI